MRNRILFCGLLALVPAPLASAQGAPEVVDRILSEGQDNSHVWETLTYLSEEIGPRLTGSTGLQRANAWTRDEFARLGLKNVHLHRWGDIPVRFDRGPCSAKLVSPEEREFEFTARAWSAGTDGPLRGKVVMMPETEEELAAASSEWEGAWLLSKSRRRGRRGAAREEEDEQARASRELRERIEAAVAEAPIAGKLLSSRNDLVTTGGHRGWRELTMETLPTDIEVYIRRSDYEALEALLEEGLQPEVEVDLVHHFAEGPWPVFNTVAEIPGTEWPHEVIILSAHLDSWDGPGSLGTQDNGTGSSVMLEAARILMAAEARPRRTIRFCLWTGEEQGLYGSKAYVESLDEEERAGISAAFVDDGGTNYQGGLVCVGNMEEMLGRAIAPAVEAFPDYEVINVVREKMPRGGASDHASFNRVGIPGFFWIEKGSGGREEKSYGFIHHTQHDTLRYAVEEYLVQSATTSAITAYNLAMADTLLPREAQNEPAEEILDPSFIVADGPLSGNWDVLLKMGEQAEPFEASYRFEMDAEGHLRGSSRSNMGTGKILSGRFDASTKEGRFKGSVDQGEYEAEFNLNEGQLEGNIQMDGQQVASFSARRPEMVETPISGSWKGLILDMDAEFQLQIQVSASGELSGRFKSSQSDSPLYEGKWDPKKNSLSFEYEYPHAGRLGIECLLKGGMLVGKINDNMAFEAKRVE